MAMSAKGQGFSRPLVDCEARTVDASIFSNDAIYRRELERVFAKNWLFLCHESQIPSAGDFFASYMAEDPVLVVRQKDQSIRVFLNQCRHRGARLCRAEAGKARAFTCPYHGWTYDGSGALVAVPHEEHVMIQPFDRAQWGAVQVPRIAVYAGLVFACWDSSAPAFEDYLGDFKFYFDANLDRAPGGTEVIGGVHKWIVPANWKLAAEQFASDIYHFGITHAGSMMALLPPDLPADAAGAGAPVGRQARSGLGHGGAFGADPQVAIQFVYLSMGPVVGDYFAGPAMKAACERLGDVRGRQGLGVHMTLFPNFSMLPPTGSIRVWHPRGPNEIEVWQWTLVDREAPEEVKDAFRIHNQQAFGSSGVFEQDDSDNWSDIGRVLRGHMARQSRFNLSLGGGQSTDPNGVFPGTTDVITSEAAARSFYARWSALMGGDAGGEPS